MIATCLMALLSNYPFVLAPGMGLNAYFAYTVVLGMGYTWQMALAAVFVEGVIFILLSLTNVREADLQLHSDEPETCGIRRYRLVYRVHWSAECQNCGGQRDTGYSVFSFKSVRSKTGPSTAMGITVLLALIGILITGSPSCKERKGQHPVGYPDHLGSWYHLPVRRTVLVPNPEARLLQPASGFLQRNLHSEPGADLYEDGLYQCIPLDFVVIMFAFLFVDMFDTLGTLIGVASKADMLDKDGKLPNIKGALLADAVGTAVGAVLGTSTTTTFVESASGVAEGGRTGLTAVVAAILFGTVPVPVTDLPGYPVLCNGTGPDRGRIFDADLHHLRLILRITPRQSRLTSQ